MKKLTNEEFIKRCKEKFGDEFSYDKTTYKNVRTKVIITDKNGNDFSIYPQMFLERYKNTGIIRYNKENFIKESKKIFGDRYTYDKVECSNSHDDVIITCPIHGDFIKKAYAHLIQKQGCPKCGKSCKTLTTEDFIQRANAIHNNRFDYSKVIYERNDKKICIICPEHGEFWQTPNVHLRGCGCPKCKNSILENKTENFLIKEKIEYETQKKFDWLYNKQPLFLDFYLPHYNIAIECQGIQHFKPINHFGGKTKYNERKKNDELKKNLCDENGVKIIYLSNENFETFLGEKVIHDYGELLHEINKGGL